MKRLLTVALTVIVALTMTLGTSVCAYGASSKDALELEATTAILIDAKTGEILFSEIYHGEIQDYTKERRQVGKAVLFEHTDDIGQIVAQESEPVQVTKRFDVKERIVTPKGELVFDFGQNMAGLVEIRLPKLNVPVGCMSVCIAHAVKSDASVSVPAPSTQI